MSTRGAALTLILRAVGRALAFVGLFVVLVLLASPFLPEQSSLDAAGTAAVGGVVTLTAALVAGWLLLYLLDHRAPAALGLPLRQRSLGEVGQGLLTGCVMLLAVLVPLWVFGWVRYTAEPGSLAGVLGAWAHGFATLATPAAAEEALFRGYGFQALVLGLGAGPATIVSSAAFAAAHLGNPDLGALALVNIFLAGVLLSVAYLRTGSLWFAIGLHLGWNWAMASLADLPVSGLTFLSTPLYEPVEHGPAWIAGGGFGPEGGLAGTAAFLLGLLLLRRVRPARGQVPAWSLLPPRIRGWAGNAGSLETPDDTDGMEERGDAR